MAIDTTTLATRLGSAVKVLNETNTLNAGNRSATVTALASYAQQLVIQSVLADRLISDQSFTRCFYEWVRQMNIAGDSFAQALCGTTVAGVGSPTGTPSWLTSDLDAYGQRSDYLVPDVLVLQATTATTVSVNGKAATSSSLDAAWPTGSGVATTLTLTDPGVTSSLSDPGFESWSSSGPPYIPTSWSIAAGSAGSTVNRVTDGFLNASGYSLQFVGDTTALRVRQSAANLSTGTYAIHVALKKTVAAVNTGTVSVTLRDASGNVISATGVSQTFSGLTLNTWTPLTAAVYVPAQLTNGCFLEVRWTGGASDALSIDCLSIIPMPTLYTAGLRLAGFVGATGMVAGADQWTATTTLSSGTITGKLAKGIDRLLNISNIGARLPTSASPTQADSLIA